MPFIVVGVAVLMWPLIFWATVALDCITNCKSGYEAEEDKDDYYGGWAAAILGCIFVHKTYVVLMRLTICLPCLIDTNVPIGTATPRAIGRVSNILSIFKSRFDGASIRIAFISICSINDPNAFENNATIFGPCWLVGLGYFLPLCHWIIESFPKLGPILAISQGD